MKSKSGSALDIVDYTLYTTKMPSNVFPQYSKLIASYIGLVNEPGFIS